VGHGGLLDAALRPVVRGGRRRVARSRAAHAHLHAGSPGTAGCGSGHRIVPIPSDVYEETTVPAIASPVKARVSSSEAYNSLFIYLVLLHVLCRLNRLPCAACGARTELLGP
jgi:hypothetical protein